MCCSGLRLLLGGEVKILTGVGLGLGTGVPKVHVRVTSAKHERWLSLITTADLETLVL